MPHLLKQPALGGALASQQSAQPVTEYFAFGGMGTVATIDFTRLAVSFGNVMPNCRVVRWIGSRDD